MTTQETAAWETSIYNTLYEGLFRDFGDDFRFDFLMSTALKCSQSST